MAHARVPRVCTRVFTVHVLVQYAYLFKDKLFAWEFSVGVGDADRVVDGLSVSVVSGAACVNVPRVVRRPRVVPLRTLGSSYRPTPLG